MWAGGVHHSWRFGHVEALREVGPERFEIKNINGASRLSQLLEFFRCDPNDFLSWSVTMYETWLYHYDPETKQQSMEWRHSGSPRPKKFRVQKSAGKVLASIFWDQTASSSLTLRKGQPVNACYEGGVELWLHILLTSALDGRFILRSRTPVPIQ